MSIHFLCSCGQKISVPASFAGRKGQCNHCGAVLSIPPAIPPLAPGAAAIAPPPSRYQDTGDLAPALPELDLPSAGPLKRRRPWILLALIGLPALLLTLSVTFYFMDIWPFSSSSNQAKVLAYRTTQNISFGTYPQQGYLNAHGNNRLLEVALRIPADALRSPGPGLYISPDKFTLITPQGSFNGRNIGISNEKAFLVRPNGAFNTNSYASSIMMRSSNPKTLYYTIVFDVPLWIDPPACTIKIGNLAPIPVSGAPRSDTVIGKTLQ